MAGASGSPRTASAAVYLAGPSGDGLVVRHVLPTGTEAPARPARSPESRHSSSRASTRLDRNRAGDLTSRTATPPSRRWRRRASRRDCLGVWSTAALGRRPRAVRRRRRRRRRRRLRSSAAPARRVLWRFAERRRASPCAPRVQARAVRQDASPSPATPPRPAACRPRRHGPASRRVDGRRHRAGATDTTDADGFYQTSLQPPANATWTATASGVDRRRGADPRHAAGRRWRCLTSRPATRAHRDLHRRGRARPRRPARAHPEGRRRPGGARVASGRLDGRSPLPRSAGALPVPHGHLQAAGGAPGARRPRRGRVADGDASRVVVRKG